MVLDCDPSDAAGDFLKLAKEVVCTMVETLRDCLSNWSIKRAHDEVSSVVEVLTQVAATIALADRLMWILAHDTLDEVLCEWEDRVVSWKRDEDWPPEGVTLDADVCIVATAEVMAKAMVDRVRENLDWMGQWSKDSSVVAEALAPSDSSCAMRWTPSRRIMPFEVV